MRTFGQLANRIHAGVDTEPLGIEYNVVKPHVLLLDIKISAKCASACSVKALDLLSHRTSVLAAVPVDHNADAELHRGTHAGADHPRHITEQGRGILTDRLQQNRAALSMTSPWRSCPFFNFSPMKAYRTATFR
jgi:hypothetical protein